MELVFATGNMHKLEEARRILGDSITIKIPADFGITEEIPETSDTIEGNSLQKCRYIWNKCGKACFADDTGLFVDALEGEPGVRSARYAGENKKPEDNIKKLLANLKGVPRYDKNGRKLRTARFICVISLIMNGEEHTFEGRVEGEIALEPSGTGGFGYDPVFIPSEIDGKRKFSEITPEEKNAISHRGRAMKQLEDFLKKNYDRLP